MEKEVQNFIMKDKEIKDIQLNEYIKPEETSNMNELIFSVYDVFSTKENSNFLKMNEIFNIPEYQRGYKWDSENVKTLLDDLRNFHDKYIESNNKAMFYCLQNITLIKTQNGYNIVDGQQRLTTLLILLSFLNESDILLNKIKYSVREETHLFIKEKILTKDIWKSDIKLELAKTKDQYYICDVAKAIQEWFSLQENLREKFTKTILNHVKLIVNPLEGDEEKIFSNLNGGKIQLDGADLIRAILMTRAAKEKFGASESNSQVNEFRVRMGIELDDINRWWSDKNVRKFFEQILPDSMIKDPKIQFNHKIFPINLLYMLYFESKKLEKKETPFSFKFFEYGQNSNERKEDDHWEMYDEIKNLHNILQDWHDDKAIYHYLGFLFNRYKGKKAINQTVTFRDIFEKWKDCKSKKEFELLLKSLIEYLILMPDENEKFEKDESLNKLKIDIENIKYNWFDNNMLLNILILKDVLHILNSNNVNKLSIDYFKPNNEDKEHIRSQTPKWKEETRNKHDWSLFINDFKDISDTEKKALIADILPIDNEDLSDDQLQNISNKMNEIGLNSIGNMALLNLGVNRGYGNSDYSHKKAIILDNYFSGVYIRPHTLNVFMKGNSESNNNHNIWSIDDIKQNARAIYKSIETWINQ